MLAELGNSMWTTVTGPYILIDSVAATELRYSLEKIAGDRMLPRMAHCHTSRKCRMETAVRHQATVNEAPERGTPRPQCISQHGAPCLNSTAVAS